MERRELLHRVAIGATVAVLAVVAIAAPASAACSDTDFLAGKCGPSNTGSEVVIDIVDTTPPSGPSGPGTVQQPGPPAEDESDCYNGLRECFDATDPDPAGPVTMRDIAAFRPAPEVDHMEPNGWMVVGLETNFYATGGVRTVTGQLLGQAATVRFYPAAWHWDYGDGSSATKPTRGTSWAAAKVPEFDKTATSHLYRRAGTFTIRLGVEYYAEYQYAGSPWYPVIGTLTVPANPLVATAGSADTVLVEEECTLNPSGPGC